MSKDAEVRDYPIANPGGVEFHASHGHLFVALGRSARTLEDTGVLLWASGAQEARAMASKWANRAWYSGALSIGAVASAKTYWHVAARSAREAKLERDEEIVQGVAEAFWFTSWADFMEQECGESLSGMKIEDAAPLVPDSARELADAFLDRFERANDELVNVTYLRAASTPGGSRRGGPKDFGFAIAMQGMGTGVAWTDDHPEPQLGMKVPHFEVTRFNFEDDLKCDGET